MMHCDSDLLLSSPTGLYSVLLYSVESAKVCTEEVDSSEISIILDKRIADLLTIAVYEPFTIHNHLRN